MDNNTEIKVSVIMPIYNAYDYLRPAMDSVLDQTLSDIEVICVDDGSTDHSLEILKEYQERDSRVRIITETNAGPARARNNGLRRARGKFVAFLDADDFYEPIFLESLYDAATSGDLDVTICRYDIYDTRHSRFEPNVEADFASIYLPGKVTSKNEHPDHILMSTVGAAWNKLFRRSFIEEKGLSFLTDVRLFEDVYFVVTAMSLAERVGKVFDVLAHHRIHSGQSRAKTFGKYYAQVPVVYQKIKEFLMHHGMYAPLAVSYLNLSASRCYKIFNLLQGDSEEKFWNMLHEGYAERLGWNEYSVESFTNDDVREFVAGVQMFDFKMFKKRASKGQKLRSARYEQDIKNAKTRKKIRLFFAKLFSKKKGTNVLDGDKKN